MNVLAHRIPGGVSAPRRYGARVIQPVRAIRVPAVHVPRAVAVLTASLGATTVAMVVLQRVSERIG